MYTPLLEHSPNPEMKSIDDVDNAIINLVFEHGTLGAVHLSQNAVFGYDIPMEKVGEETSLCK